MTGFTTGNAEGNRTAILAEFSALRAEIAARSSAQHTLLNLNLTASGVVLGTALAQRANLAVLLVVPIIGCCFGLLFIDHAAVIEKLGRVIPAPRTANLVAVVVMAAGHPAAGRSGLCLDLHRR